MLMRTQAAVQGPVRSGSSAYGYWYDLCVVAQRSQAVSTSTALFSVIASSESTHRTTPTMLRTLRNRTDSFITGRSDSDCKYAGPCESASHTLLDRQFLPVLVNFEKSGSGRSANMPTRNVNLTDYHDEFVNELVTSGRFSSASEVVGAGLRLPEQQAREEEEKLALLRSMAAEGFRALHRS